MQSGPPPPKKKSRYFFRFLKRAGEALPPLPPLVVCLNLNDCLKLQIFPVLINRMDLGNSIFRETVFVTIECVFHLNLPRAVFFILIYPISVIYQFWSCAKKVFKKSETNLNILHFFIFLCYIDCFMRLLHTSMITFKFQRRNSSLCIPFFFFNFEMLIHV